MKRIAIAILGALSLAASAFSQTLNLPRRPADAPGGLAFAQSIMPLEREEREEKIIAEIARGNVPDFLRTLCPVTVSITASNESHTAVYYVTPDYLAVGSDSDYFLTPLTPISAQRVADLLHCSLPTRRMVDQIYAAAKLKLEPNPIPPSSAMTTVEVFIAHNSMVSMQRAEKSNSLPLGTLTAGHKKDVVISAKLATRFGKVAIYGWHQPDGHAIQPLYLGHAETWADYSHGIRLVAMDMTSDGVPTTVPEILASSRLSGLLSDEGPFERARYATNFSTNATTTLQKTAAPGGRVSSNNITSATNLTLAVGKTNLRNNPMDLQFGEKIESFKWDPEVLVSINTDAKCQTSSNLELIFYALPNGNTIQQTIGHQLRANDDWHFDIQHIGAQTRYIRGVETNHGIAVVYLQAEQLSWPAWRKKHSDHPELLAELVESIKSRFKNHELNITLSSHSGGGGAIFGYINAVTNIPNDVKRIAFLDSDYGYDESAGHYRKLMDWLGDEDDHFLSVLAYQDYVALLNGKTFVSERGGTWGRSQAMIKDFGRELIISSQTNGVMEKYTAMRGRVKFLLLENPEKKILHTVQVERNGFIQSMLSGTDSEGKGYEYFGPRAYTNFIAGK